ncbi:MAG: CdaR family protein [Bryobacteraceae bacterium]|jgi:YbbR domain-containing protein
MNRQAWEKLALRVAALAAAFVLWLIFVRSPELTMSVGLPIQCENAPSDLEVSWEAPRRVEVEISGPKARLRRLDLSGRAVVLDLAGVQAPGERTFLIDRRQIDLPGGVRVIRVVPAQVRLRFEPRGTANAAVKVRFLTDPPPGYRVVAAEARPGVLKIAGPESRVRQIAWVETDPLDVSRVLGSAKFQVSAFIPDPQVHFVASPVVEVTVTVAKLD